MLGHTKCRFLLMLLMALSYTGIFIQGFFYDGSPIAKYITKQIELDRVQEQQVFEYMESSIFGDGNTESIEENDLSPKQSAEESAKLTKTVFNYDKIVLLGGLLFVWLILIPKIYQKKWMSLGYLLLALYLASIA